MERDSAPTGHTKAQEREAPIDRDTPLYSGRIAMTYVEYLERFYSHVDTDAILAQAGTSRREAENADTWYSQKAVEAFHAAMTAVVKAPDICRKAGRYAAQARATGTLKRLALGLLSPGSFYVRMPPMLYMMNRGFTYEGGMLGRNRAEIIVTPRPGMEERPFQCESRMGAFEGAALVFLQSLPHVEHSECLHKGGSRCRYVISWDTTPTYRWRKLRTFMAIISCLIALTGMLFLPLHWWLSLTLLVACITIATNSRYLSLENDRLHHVTDTHTSHAEEILNELSMHNAHSRLLLSIAEASSQRLDETEFLHRGVEVLEQGLNHKNVDVILLNGDDSEEHIGSRYLRASTKGRFEEGVNLARLDQAHWVSRAIREMELVVVRRGDGQQTTALAKEAGFETLVCVPLVYNEELLGTLSVMTLTGEPDLTETEMMLIEVIATQIAVGIHNARAFQAIEASEHKYRALVESANSAIVRFKPDGELTFINTFARQLFTLTSEVKEGSPLLGTVFPYSEEAYGVIEGLIERCRAEPDRLVVFETHEETPLQTNRSVAWTIRGVVDREGAIVEVLAIGSDISELKDADREKERLTFQLHQAQKMESIGTLAGGVAHDFNNLLTGIVGNITFLMSQTPKEDSNYSLLQEVDTLASSAGELTWQLLGFARHGKYQVKPTEINALVRSTLRFFHRTNKEIEIEEHLDGSLWPVLADRGQIEQTLLNLFVNAGQSMPQGGLLSVETGNVDASEDAPEKSVEACQHIRIVVRDRGVGMDEKTRARVFEPFFTTKERERGTGLGLASSYGIITNHNGTISVESRVGEGTCFEIRLPALPDRALPSALPQVKPVGGSGTVLVVDDEVLVLRATGRMLKLLGYEVLVANSGREALKIFEKKPDSIDLVLLDMIMPEMNGEEVFDELVAVEPKVRVLLSSGFSAGDQANRVIEKGARGFLAKPFDSAQLSEKVSEAIRNSGAHRR